MTPSVPPDTPGSDRPVIDSYLVFIGKEKCIQSKFNENCTDSETLLIRSVLAFMYQKKDWLLL